MNVTGKLCQLRQALRSCRNIHVTSLVKNVSAYEGPGKTTVTFISKEIGPRILISKCNKDGFTLHNGMVILGPTVLFPRQALCWNIASAKYINDTTLSLFTVLEPKPDLLIIGVDSQYNLQFIRSTQKLMYKYNITVEILPVFQACKVFNFVNEEGRYVIAALIPQQSAHMLPRIDMKRATNSDDPKSKSREDRTDKKLE
ncbi:NADH dehydrogenase [ubiquinone] 1 alpha subcomplex assembly factor 3 isoform X1 [Odontomachus brunneus]|uniref:NADH dehydrogenase [ubiquinone] 1 alpha subcomplex assembly factor 3 isoform X1 n=1 Tax=Odontomachus brunneus TaxID=486640 RepID=UPI0013F1F71C|nr:NADH dehydrogenase [ubiquinone] 1 alpha subcomplex assembly factor 3 isoform X1 [Odontomachus brunneus]